MGPILDTGVAATEDDSILIEQFLATASEEDVEQLRQLASEAEARELEKLERFGQSVQSMVREAVEARESSGIESRWLEDLRQYYGSDWSLMAAAGVVESALKADANKLGGGETSKQRQTKSKILVNITRPKTNAVISRLGDMLLPTDDRNWGLKPTPNPALVKDQLDEKTVMTRQGQPMQGPDGKPLTKGQAATQLLEDAKDRCEAMEREIDDQLVECNYNGEFRKGLWDKGVLGTMIMRGPFARTVRAKRWMRDLQTGRWAMEVQEKEVPASERVSPWNFYPDPACGGDIRNARYVVEMAEYNKKTLRALRKQKGYIDSQIVQCLHESPKREGRARLRDQRSVPGEYEFPDDTVYTVYMVHGEFERGMLEDAGVEGCECEDEDQRQEAISGCVFLCNGKVIKAALNPLDSGELPYDVSAYEKVEGQVFGVGVPFILRNPSRVVIAGWRMAMDNSALSGGVQVIVNRKFVEPADGQWSMSGTKVWVGKDGLEDVNKAFAVHQVNSRVAEIMQVIDRALHFAEDESSMPAIMEGSQRQAPEQVGVANLLNNNANTVLRRLVKQVDDHITDPHITRYYDWNMQHSEKEEIKGDFQVDARGTSVLMVRDGQKQTLMQVGQFVLHPMLGRFHKNSGFDWLKQMYESNHLDSSAILVDEAEVPGIIQQMQEQAQQQPAPPQIEVAKIRAEVENMKLGVTKEDRERDRQHELQLAQMRLQTEQLRYAERNGLTLEQTRNQMLALMSQRESEREQRAHEDNMQQREIAVKRAQGTGI